MIELQGFTDRPKIKDLEETDVSLWARGGRVELARLRVPPGEKVEVEVTLPDTRLMGRVVWDDDGEPIEDARVSILAEQLNLVTGELERVQKAVSLTREDGSFRAGYLGPGEYVLCVECIEGLFLATTPVTPSELRAQVVGPEPVIEYELRVKRAAKDVANVADADVDANADSRLRAGAAGE